LPLPCYEGPVVFVKTVTIGMPTGDERDDEIVRFLHDNFPELTEVVFGEDVDLASPRVLDLTGANRETELARIDSALFRHFNPTQ